MGCSHLTTRRLAATGSLFTAMLFANTASADDCPTSPHDWDSETCRSVCSTASGTWTCSVAGSVDDAMITAVKNYDSSSYDYNAWGHYWYQGEGGYVQQHFCCYTDDSIDAVMLVGSNHDDILSFYWDATGEYLESAGTGLTGTIAGGTGIDTIYGSNSTNAAYSETLLGGGDADIIRGLDGDDEIYGDGGDDTLFGNAGDDTIYGGLGNDEILGGAGLDTLLGEGGNDVLAGGPDDDYLDGGLDGDVLCGDEDGGVVGDELHEGESYNDTPSDFLWGNTGADSLNCESTNAHSDGNGSQDGSTSCITDMTSRPGQCP